MPATAKPATAKPPARHASRPARYVTAAYAVVCYAVFLAVFAYAVGFFASAIVPRSIDHGPGSSWPLAAGTDLLLLALFAVQHSVMARPWFKRAWTRLVPEPAERATFVLATSLVLALLFWQWRPVRGTVWQLSGSGAAAVLAVYAAGWLLVLPWDYGVLCLVFFCLGEGGLFVASYTTLMFVNLMPMPVLLYRRYAELTTLGTPGRLRLGRAP